MNTMQVALMATKTVLLINREPSVREVMQACLSHLGGWQVLSAAAAADGLQQAVAQQPDAIVLDFAFPNWDSLLLLRQLQANPATQAIPVVLMTDGAKWLDWRRFQEFQVVGAIDYFSDPTQFPQQIATLLNWRSKPSVD